MALIKCPECGKEVSSSAVSCPNCGFGINAYYEKIECERQREIQEEKINKYKEKLYSAITNKKVLIILVVLLFISALGVIVYKSTHKEVIHGVSWGMSPAEVQAKEEKYSNVNGYYDKDNDYYAVSEVDFLGEKVDLMYEFEDNKLETIVIVPYINMYEYAYQIAYNICKTYNLPISVEDRTEQAFSTSIITWNTKGTEINLVAQYGDDDTYTFLLRPYEGNEYGEKYKNKGICQTGSALAWGACENEIVPWSEDAHCYLHRCFVLGCDWGVYTSDDRDYGVCWPHLEFY